MKLTREQVEGRHEKAIRFTDTVLGDTALSEELADLTVEEYADRKKIEIIDSNPRRPVMATLRDQVDELETTIAEAQEVMEDSYTPEASREEMAEALGKAIDLLTGEEPEEDEPEEAEPE